MVISTVIKKISWRKYAIIAWVFIKLWINFVASAEIRDRSSKIIGKKVSINYEGFMNDFKYTSKLLILI